MRFSQHIIKEESDKVLTDFMETASCIGIICDPSLSNSLKKFLDTNHMPDESMDVVADLLKKVKAVNGVSGYDWVMTGVDYIDKITLDSPGRVNVLFNLIVGMNEFMQDVGYKVFTTQPYFIHRNIKAYRDAEKDAFGVIPNAKDNASDCIICSKHPKELLADMVGSQPDKGLRYMTTPKGIKFIQVSLKKEASEAQLGKIKTMVSGMYKTVRMKDAVDMFTNQLGESVVNEGVWDKLLSFGSHLTSLFRGVLQKVLSLSGKVNKNHLSAFEKSMGIHESRVGSSTAPMKDKDKRLVESIIGNSVRATSIINNEIKKLQAMTRNKKIPIKADNVGSFSITTSTHAFKIVSNYLALKTLQEMVADSSALQVNVTRIIGEMYFGGTKLPMWKVFGYFGKKSYHYMGTLETFLDDRSYIPTIEVLGVRINKLPNSYAITMYMIDDIDPKGKTYIMVRTGTNSAVTSSFVLEGSDKLGPVPFPKPLIELI